MKKMDFNSDAFYKKLASLEKKEQTQVLSPSIFEHKTVLAAPVPFYEEMVRSAAAGKFSPLLQEAHGKNDSLKGVEGNPKVHDLVSAHDEIMGVMSKEVKAKKAELKERLIVLCAQLREGGKADLALQVEAQVEKLAEEEKVSALSQVKSTVLHIFTFAKDIYESVAAIPEEEFMFAIPKVSEIASAYRLAGDLKRIVESFADLPPKNLKIITDTSKSIVDLLNGAVAGVSDLPSNVVKMLENLNDLASIVKSLGDAGAKNKGLAQVADILNRALPGLIPTFKSVSSDSWASIDAALKQFLGLYHSSSKGVPAHGQTYSTLSELKQLIGKEIAELQAEKRKSLDAPQEGGVNKSMQDQIKSTMEAKKSSSRGAVKRALLDIPEGETPNSQLVPARMTAKDQIRDIVNKLNAEMPKLDPSYKALDANAGWTMALQLFLRKNLGLEAGKDFRNYRELNEKIDSSITELAHGIEVMERDYEPKDEKPKVNLNAPINPAEFSGGEMRERLRDERVSGAGIQMGNKAPVSPFDM